MMKELQEVKKAVNPSDTLLVVDAMTGQEAAALTKAFNDAASITGESLLAHKNEARVTMSTTTVTMKSRLVIVVLVVE
jgi:signal recognition particle subunit SRP54